MQPLKKERIKDRMIRTTARLWGIQENEIEANFDPLVMLMIEACAAELEKIGYDMNASHERLLEKLADLMVPESALGPRPASAVMQATPLDIIAAVNSTTRFYCTQRISRPELRNSYTTDIYFTPVGQFPLVKTTLNYIMAGDKLYSIRENNTKELVHGNDTHDHQQVHEIWLALTPDKALQSLKNLSLFFDLRSHSEARNFYKSLETAKLTIGDQPLTIETGYANEQQFSLSPEEMLVSGQDYTGKINRKIAGIYRDQFLHITSDNDIQGFISKNPPAEWEQLFPQPVLQKVAANPMLYVKLQLGRPFYQDVLNGLICHVNAFPVINRKMNSIMYRTDTWINIVPLQIEGSFLDLQHITGSSGKKYRFRSDAAVQGMEEGEAAVRSSGIGKTNSREVREIISSLTEAIRDESAYFSEISNEFVLSRLREISQILTRLEDQLVVSKDKQAPRYYILLRPQQAGDHVSIDFWTTNAEDANQVKSGTVMNAFNHTLVGAKAAYLVTSAIGGKSGISETEKRLFLKQQIASRGKLVSAEDLKLLCVQLLGSYLRQVTVEKGVQAGNTPSQGFIRTIDVKLDINPEASSEAGEEITYLCKELEYTLQTEGTPVYPFRVIVNSYNNHS